MQRVYLFLILSLLTFNSNAQQIGFSVKFENDTMLVGDTNNYVLQLVHSPDITIRSIDLKPIQKDAFIQEEDSFYESLEKINIDSLKEANAKRNQAYFDSLGFAEVHSSYNSPTDSSTTSSSTTSSTTGIQAEADFYNDYLKQAGFSREVMEIYNYGKWDEPDESMIYAGNSIKWNTQNVGGKVLKTNKLLFTFFEEGTHSVLPPLIEYEYNGNIKTIVAKDIINIRVSSPLDSIENGILVIDPSLIAPNKTIMEEPFDWMEDFFIPLGFFLLGVLVLVGLIYLVIKQSKKKEEIVLPQREEYIPASNIAMDKLTQLKSEQLWQKDQVKEYQSQLTYIIREYLENRYEIPALENTTFQIGNDLKSLNLNEGLRTEVQNILQVADLVKFAKAEPDANVHEQFMTKAEEFVRATKKSDAEIEAEKEKAELEYQQKLEVAQAKKITKK